MRHFSFAVIRIFRLCDSLSSSNLSLIQKKKSKFSATWNKPNWMPSRLHRPCLQRHFRCVPRFRSMRQSRHLRKQRHFIHLQLPNTLQWRPMPIPPFAQIFESVQRQRFRRTESFGYCQKWHRIGNFDCYIVLNEGTKRFISLVWPKQRRTIQRTRLHFIGRCWWLLRVCIPLGKWRSSHSKCTCSRRWW